MISASVAPSKQRSQTPKSPSRLERRPEGAAHHGTKFVEFTGPGRGVEHGTGLVVGKLIPAFAIFVVVGFIEQAGGGVAGVFGGKAGDGVQSAFADAGGAVGVVLFGLRETVAQAEGVELIDGEDAVATMRAAGTAGQPFAAALHGVGEGGITIWMSFWSPGGSEGQGM